MESRISKKVGLEILYKSISGAHLWKSNHSKSLLHLVLSSMAHLFAWSWILNDSKKSIPIKKWLKLLKEKLRWLSTNDHQIISTSIENEYPAFSFLTFLFESAIKWLMGPNHDMKKNIWKLENEQPIFIDSIGFELQFFWLKSLVYIEPWSDGSSC